MEVGKRLFYATSCFFELAKGIILATVAIMLVHLFIATIFIVDGISMEPNLHSGQIILVNRWTYLTGSPARGDAVVLRFPGDSEHRKFIKRIVGLPGETVDLKDGKVLINQVALEEVYLPPDQVTPVMVPGQEHWQLGPDDYFVVGDNRPNSNDSRTWGAAEKRFLIGKAVFILWPPADTGLVPKVSFE